MEDKLSPPRDGLLSDDPTQGFQGKIGKTLRESRPWWPSQKRAPAGAPNIIIILLDDVGFSDFACYGAEIQTPNIDALAAGGLRFSQYTTVPMCTPARAALMTGKNPHAVGCGWLTHNNPGYPGYRAGEMSKDAPTIAELLRANGYSTYAVGKWHNTADYNVTESGDRDAWPVQRGFDRFYGFLGAEIHYFAPSQLFEDNALLERESYPDNYYSSDDWTGKAIHWIKSHLSSAPAKPFFLYLAHNAPHVPLHAKPADIAKYQGAYDCGWDEIRKRRFRRQRELGVVPENWQMSGRTPGIPAWEANTIDERALHARYMELYAAILDNVDQNVGTLTTFLRDIGVLDNTLLILTSDNGATSIGGNDGAVNILAKRVSRTERPGIATAMMKNGELGGTASFPAYPVGWGNASNTPFRLYKRTPMNGGIRVPYIVHWPSGIRDPGAIRHEWVHVTDTVPTLLDLVGFSYPNRFNGYRTRGLDGVSYRDVLLSADAKSTRAHQHYELEGNRGYIRGRWKIVSLQPPGATIDLNTWMLFDLENDATECNDLASRMPDKLAELIQAFEADAEANYIYPLDNRDLRRCLTVPPFLEPLYQEARIFYPGTNTVAMGTVAPLIADRDYRLECRYSYRASDEGVIFAVGDTFSGLVLFVRAGKACFVYNGEQQLTVLDALPIETGENHFVLEHRAMGDRQGIGVITINGRRAAADVAMSPTTIPGLTGEGLDVGLDRKLKVSSLYHDRGCFAYTGTIAFVRIEPGKRAPGGYANRPELEAQRD